MRKPAIIVAVLAFCLAVVGAITALKKQDSHYSAERRERKNNASSAMKRDLEDPRYLATRSISLPDPANEWDSGEPENWLRKDTILFKDGTWMAYRSHCHKQDHKIHDIFIGRGSDSGWYYSDYHFCIDAVGLSMNGQPESLAAFKKESNLAAFDGTSDEALKPTWGSSRP